MSKPVYLNESDLVRRGDVITAFNNELIGLNEGLYKLNDELLKTVDELTKKLNGGE